MEARKDSNSLSVSDLGRFIKPMLAMVFVRARRRTALKNCQISESLSVQRFTVYLHERVWCDFDDDCIGWDVLECLVEEHRRARVVDVVLSRAGRCQVGLPLGLRDGSGNPARRTRLRLWNGREHGFVHLLFDGEHCGRVEGNSRSVDNLK